MFVAISKDPFGRESTLRSPNCVVKVNGVSKKRNPIYSQEEIFDVYFFAQQVV